MSRSAIIFLLLICFLFLYFFFRYIVQPYRRMISYQTYKNSHLVPFNPLLGSFAFSKNAYELTGDEKYYVKKSFEDNPDARFFVFNALDKCILLLLDPALLQDFFQKQQMYKKQQQFIANKIRFFGRGVAFAQGEQWSKRRKIMSSIFHFSFYNKFIPKILDILNVEIEKIQKLPHRQMQAKQFSTSISGDTIVKTFFGITFLEKIDDQSISVWLSELIGETVMQQKSLRYLFFGSKILQIGLFDQDRNVNRKIAQYKAMAKQSILKKLNENQQQEGTILHAIKQKKLFQTSQGYTIEELIDQFSGFFVAGTDTTAHLMTMCFYYLSLYQQCQTKLRDEMVQTKILDNLQFRNITSLKYLQAFVRQTFRHYNYMVSTFPRICIKDHYLGQILVRQGDVVMPGWSHNMYNPKYFPNPEHFDPERWMNPDQSQLAYIYSPFSMGSRSCLGQHFALLETKIVLIKMVSKYIHILRPGYKHLLKTNSLYGPVNSINIDLKLIEQI